MTTLRRYTMVATLLGLTVAGLVLQPVASTAVASTEAPTPAPSFYVANGNHSLTAYAEGASGNASPVATISGPQTGLWSPKRIAIDEAGRILSYNGSDPGREIVHAPGASGNAAPIAATKPVSHSTVLDSLAVRDGYVYIADDFRNSVYKYAVGPTGEFTWVSALGGSSSTQIRRPHAIALDRLGYLYIANNDYPNASYSITKYAPGAKDGASPVAAISGSSTGLVNPTSLAVDDAGRLFVGNGTNKVDIFAPGADGDIVPVASIQGSNTGLDKVTGLAIGRDGRLIVTNAGSNSVTLYAAGSVGDARPVSIIAGSATGLVSPAAVAATPEVIANAYGALPSATPGQPYNYQLRASGGTSPYTWSLAHGTSLPEGLILGLNGVISGSAIETPVQEKTFSVTATDSTTGRPYTATTGVTLRVIPPARYAFYVASTNDTIRLHTDVHYGADSPIGVLEGSNSGLSSPSGLLIGPSGRVYVANVLNNTITQHAPDAEGNAAPVALLGGPSTGLSAPSSMVIDRSGRLYVSNYRSNSVTVYDAGATGDTRPLATLSGPATGLSGPSALAMDARGRLFVGNTGNNTVSIYAPDSAGDVAPVATIAGPATKLNGPSGILLDADGTLIVANIFGHTITMYAADAAGDVAPIATLAGPRTGLLGPRGLAVNGVGGLIVGNNSGHSVTRYAPGAVGDAPPIVTVGVSYAMALLMVPPLTITSDVSHGTADKPYSHRLAVTGGAAPYMWSLAPGSSLPPGLTLNVDGTVAGIPTHPGTTTFTIEVADSWDGTPFNGSRSLSLTIKDRPLIIETSSLPSGTVGEDYGTTLAVTGGAPPYAWSVTPENGLTPGLSLSAAGTLSGVPTVAGTTSFNVQVTDTGTVSSQTTVKGFTLTVNRALTETQTVSSSVSPAVLGQEVVLTTTVSGKSASLDAPTGMVDFYDGTVKIGSAGLVNGRVNLSTSALAVGRHSITARYAGDVRFEGSVSQALLQEVTYGVKLLYDGTSSSKSGANVLIKVALVDAAGRNVSAEQIVLTVSGVTPSGGTADLGGNFSYERTLSKSGGYRFDLKTKGYASGSYTLQFKVTGDPVTHDSPFAIR